VRCHFTPSSIAIIKKKKEGRKKKITSIGKDVERLKPSYITGRNVKWYSHLENSSAAP